jgi:hypothetical protein
VDEVLAPVLPLAVAWAEERAGAAAVSGAPLDERGLALARAAEVRRPERVRVVTCAALPEPEDPALRAAAREAGLLDPRREGLTLGHAIFVRRGSLAPRLLSHELRHVYQYEEAGSIAAFLAVYLRQVLEHGYDEAPLEADARRHERRARGRA